MTVPAGARERPPTGVWSSTPAIALVVTAAVVAALTFRPIFSIVVSQYGPAPVPSCTMEAAAGCALANGPQMIGNLIDVLYLFVLTIGVAVAIGTALVVSILVVPRWKRRRVPFVRAALGSYALAFTVAGVVFFLTGRF